MAAPPEALIELDALLQSLQGLKPPGVNKTKVEAITKICTAMQNTSSQVQIVDIIINNFNRVPSTHKLGLVYIVDTVTRHWKAAGLTWAAGVNRMTEALPALMNTLLQVAPENQKEKIAKLLDIWISSRTFPDHLLTNYKAAFIAPTPASQGLPQGATSNNHIAQAASNGTNGAAPPPPNAAASALLAQLGNVQPSGLPPQALPALSAVSVNPPPVNVPAPVFPTTVPPLPTSNQNALAASLNSGTQAPANALAALQLLQSLGTHLSPENIQAVLQAAGIPMPAASQPQGAAVPPPPFPPASAPPAQPQFSTPEQSNQYRGGYDDRSRARSRSPDYNRRYSPPDRRDSPYGVYDASGANNHSSQTDNDRRGRGKGRGFRNDYRQRTPPPMSRDRPASPQGAIPRSNMPKPMGYDPKIPNGKIRVLSRTLFVGGVSGKTNETELKHFFSRFGNVQSCIVNHDKRHAFLKLISHQDAQVTKQAVDMLPSDEYRGKFERIGWAVGFGPTQFADYKEGTSEIPINVLTDADRKWMLNAEYGGTGGKQIESGMIVEEPDIEIGAGPSSKAISRRGGGQQGGGRGGGNFNQRRGYERHAAYRKPDDRRQGPPPAMSGVGEPNTLGAPPAVPTFGAPIPGLPLNFR